MPVSSDVSNDLGNDVTDAVPTPEDEREARIAELRKRRRARMRWLAIRSMISLAVVAVLGTLLGYWLFNTLRGRDLLLDQIVGLLPAGNELTWSRAEGPASGPMTLYDVRFVHRGCPDRDGEPVAWPGCKTALVTTFAAQQVMLDPALAPLFGRRLRLEALHVTGATLDVPQSDEPFELPRWPQSLPAIAPPLAMRADVIEIDGLIVTTAGEPTIDLRRVRGGLAADEGRLHLEHIVANTNLGRFAVHGDYAPKNRYRMDLTASAVLPAAAGRTPARFGLVARGDLRRLDAALSGHAPAPVKAQLLLEGETQPRWRFDADSTAVTLAALLGTDDDAAPYAFELHADGVGGKANLRGRVAQGDIVAKILSSKLSVEGQTLDIAPLKVELLGGTLVANGRADFNDPADARFDGKIAARELRWQGAQKDAVAVIGNGDFTLGGHLRDWTVQGDATLLRDDQRAVVALKARGDDTTARFETLHVTTPEGRLDGNGELAWSPTLRWQADARLAGFDPGYFLPDWRGAVNGALHSTGETRDDGGLDARIEAKDLGGRLRGRALSGRANALLRLPAREGGRIDGEGTVALVLGGSRIDAKGRVADTLDIDASFAPLQLNDLFPTGEGALRGTLRLTGARAQPNIEIDLSGQSLRYDTWKAASLRVRGRLPWRAGDGALAVDGETVEAGLAMSRLHLEARGAVEALRIDADADASFGRLALAGDLARRGEQWTGALNVLRFTPATGAAWALRAPARFSMTASPRGTRLQLASSCFATADNTGALCADLDWPTRADVRADALPLALFAPYLPKRDARGEWRLRGVVDIDAQVRPGGGSWQGTARVRSAEGGLALGARSRREVITYANLELDARFDPQRIDATLSSALTPNGRVAARIATGWDGYAPLAGNVEIATEALTWLELFSPDIVDPTGRLDGRIALGGTRAQPTLGGQAELTNFKAEMPALGLSLREGSLRMDAQNDGTAVLSGRVRSGEGTLLVDGSLGWQSDDTPLRLALRGENVLISDTRELRAVIDPNVIVRYAAGQPISVAGTVRIPSAKLDLERLDSGVSASEDVVVLDPANPERTGSTPLDLDLVLAMGDKVRLQGFGLDGSLGGSVRMRARPGRETVATGSLDIAGRYSAYGQELQITRGRLLWSNTPFGDPTIDIRAERKVGNITAGLDVRGRASAPEAEVWSNPATSESEALAYLTLGRPLSSASADENRKLSSASAALSAGNYLASQLGTKLGLDDAGVSESRALGGSVVGIGKYISPRLYVSYGVSLLGTGQVITLKYLLRKGFDIEIESSTLESRGSVNWRKEK